MRARLLGAAIERRAPIAAGREKPDVDKQLIAHTPERGMFIATRPLATGFMSNRLCLLSAKLNPIHKSC